MAKYLNGYKEFRFESGSEMITFDLRIQAMTESFDIELAEHIDIGKTIHHEFLNLRYFYEIDSAQLTTKGNLKKFKRVLTWFIQNKEVILTPHIDAVIRKDKVVLQTNGGKTDRIYFSNLVAAAYSAGNKGFILKLQSKEPWNNINWIDTDEIIGVLTKGKKKILQPYTA